MPGIGYLDRVAACNNADLTRFVRWHVAGTRVGGFVAAARVAELAGPDGPLCSGPRGLELPGRDFEARSARLAAAADRLAAAGSLRLLGELYPVLARHGDPPLLQVDRGAVPWFGIRPFGVHLCAYVRRGDELLVWVAVRGRDRTFAGLWDNTVAGGQPIGLSLRANLAKECAEEAALGADHAARAVPVATLTYVRADGDTLKPDTLFCFDLELPADVAPRPHDGEVERFLLLPARELATAIRERAVCKPNCALVWIDFLLRHGQLDRELPAADRHRLAASLRQRLP